MPHQEFGTNRELVRREAQRFTRDRLRHAVELEKNISGANSRHPVLRSALALTHSGFRRTGGHGLVWEHPDPELALAFHVAGEGHAGSFDLDIGDPGTLERLQGIRAEIDVDGACRCPGAAA